LCHRKTVVNFVSAEITAMVNPFAPAKCFAGCLFRQPAILYSKSSACQGQGSYGKRPGGWTGAGRVIACVRCGHARVARYDKRDCIRPRIGLGVLDPNSAAFWAN